MSTNDRSKLLSDRTVLNQVGLTQEQLNRAVNYFKKKGILLIEDSPYCDCASDFQVLVYISDPTSPLNYKAGCPACSLQCPECDDYAETLQTYETPEGEKLEMCFFCFKNMEDEFKMEIDEDDINSRVDAILYETRLRGDVVEPNQRLISEFCAPVSQ